MKLNVLAAALAVATGLVMPVDATVFGMLLNLNGTVLPGVVCAWPKMDGAVVVGDANVPVVGLSI